MYKLYILNVSVLVQYCITVLIQHTIVRRSTVVTLTLTGTASGCITKCSCLYEGMIPYERTNGLNIHYNTLQYICSNHYTYDQYRYLLTKVQTWSLYIAQCSLHVYQTWSLYRCQVKGFVKSADMLNCTTSTVIYIPVTVWEVYFMKKRRWL